MTLRPYRVYAVFRVLLVTLFISCISGKVEAQRYKESPKEAWITYRNPEFNYRFRYPSAIFKPDDAAASYGTSIFHSHDKAARIVVSGEDNDLDFPLMQYRDLAISKLGGDPIIVYSPMGQTWFVLSGYLGNNIFYQKVLFSCGNRIINTFDIRFPAQEKAIYERLIEIMEDNFWPARDKDAPPRCSW